MSLPQDVPEYEEAFASVAEEQRDEVDRLEAKLREREERDGGKNKLPSVEEKRRKALRERAEKLAQSPLTKPEVRAALETAGDLTLPMRNPNPAAASSSGRVGGEEGGPAGWHPDESTGGGVKAPAKLKQKGKPAAAEAADPFKDATKVHYHDAPQGAHRDRHRPVGVLGPEDAAQVFGRI